MEMNVHSTVFVPANPGEPYLVVASALPVEAREIRKLQPRSECLVTTLREAVGKCCELACAIRQWVEGGGGDVLGIRCSHCPTAHAPRCGRLARGNPQGMPREGFAAAGD